MSSNTSILDDQTIDTNYFTASSSNSSSTDYNTSNDIKGITIVWNSKILPYDGSGEVISKKCTSCEQNVDDDSITTDNKEAVLVNSDDLSRIVSYITSTKEGVLFNSDTLSKIVSFLPSIDLPSLALTCKRFGSREEGELSLIEMHDEALFKQPPPKEKCQICMQQMPTPTLHTGSKYMTCCGNRICSGCLYASFRDNQGNIVIDNQKCSFCRAPRPSDDNEFIKRMKNRVEAGDAVAMFNLGVCYHNGQYRLPQDYTKALELWRRAAELGYARANTNIGYAYNTGKGVEVDKKRARHYYEHAAMRGDETARYNLGIKEKKAGNMDRALKHYQIAVRSGYHADSLNHIKRLYSDGHIPKDEYTKALRLHQEYLDEIKSDQRDQAAAANDKYRYY